MAQNWIKLRKDIHGDPAVIGIAAGTGLDVDTVVGKLTKLWSWADSHTVDGFIRNATFEWIDGLVGVNFFAENLEKNRWLKRKKGGIVIPNFERHNGESAKQRGLTAMRVEKTRNGKNVTDALPDKTRQDKSRTDKTRQDKTRAGQSSLNGQSLRAVTDNARGESAAVWTAQKSFAWEEHAAEVDRLVGVVGDPSSRKLIWQAMYAAYNGLTPAWLAAAVQGLKMSQARKPGAWLCDVLRKTALEQGRDFKALQGLLVIPPEVLNG